MDKFESLDQPNSPEIQPNNGSTESIHLTSNVLDVSNVLNEGKPSELLHFESKVNILTTPDFINAHDRNNTRCNNLNTTQGNMKAVGNFTCFEDINNTYDCYFDRTKYMNGPIKELDVVSIFNSEYVDPIYLANCNDDDPTGIYNHVVGSWNYLIKKNYVLAKKYKIKAANLGCVEAMKDLLVYAGAKKDPVYNMLLDEQISWCQKIISHPDPYPYIYGTLCNLLIEKYSNNGMVNQHMLNLIISLYKKGIYAGDPVSCLYLSMLHTDSVIANFLLELGLGLAKQSPQIKQENFKELYLKASKVIREK